MQKKIVILGAGPTGLGAAWRLKELKYDNYKVFDRQSFPGGLAASFTDAKGFTWDIGGHVQFSHYEYFDKLMDLLLGENWLFHQRESWVWIRDRFVPYPFQNNIRYLPKEDMWKCLSGLIELYRNKSTLDPRNFREWVLQNFGQGLAEVFMFPYNFKVWAYPPEKLSFSWIGERVAILDLKRVAENVIFEKDDLSWGPNNTFRFPKRGGTGEVWRQLYARLDKEKIHLNSEVLGVNTKKKEVIFKSHKESYDILISTMPLDILILNSDIKDKTPARKLVHSSTNIFGLGLKGKAPPGLKTKCWMYFPEDNCPFYRVTVFSNYSPYNVPDIKKYWSLMLEVSESPDKPVNHKTIKEQVIQGALNTRLIRSRDDIVDYWEHSEEHGYPTPSVERDAGLKVLVDLEKLGIYSRGRFGAWKYEVSNQDHSLMQGVEAVNKIVLNEEEKTVWHPEIVNAKKK